MAISFSNSGAATQTTSGAIPVTVTINAGDTVVVSVLVDKAPAVTVTSITDNGGNTYTQQIASSFQTPLTAYLWSTKPSAAIPATSVTVSFSGAYTEVEVVILTYRNVVGFGHTTANNGTATATPSVTGFVYSVPSNYLTGGIGSLSTSALTTNTGTLRAQQAGAASILGAVDNTTGTATNILKVGSSSAIFVAVSMELLASVPSRNNQNVEQGVVVQNIVAGTGSAATLVGAQGTGIYTDITSFVLTSSATTAQATLSDGTISYIFNVSTTNPISIAFPVPLKATSSNTAWTINGATAVSAAVQAITATV